jgi:hypothetical protein
MALLTYRSIVAQPYAYCSLVSSSDCRFIFLLAPAAASWADKELKAVRQTVKRKTGNIRSIPGVFFMVIVICFVFNENGASKF